MSLKNRQTSRQTRRKHRAKARNTRRVRRPGLGEALSAANSRAKQRANRRIREHLDIASIYASIRNEAHADLIHLNWSQKIFRWLLGLILLPFCFITTSALFQVNYAGTGSGLTHNFWFDLFKTRHFLFFAEGVFLMGGWFFSGLFQRFFLYLYVLGHELTHVLFVILCGGKVSSINVSADGGYIMTNKSNVLIALSPYFTPFWSLVVMIVFSILNFFFHIPYHSEVLYGLIGATWTFHLLWTLWMIPRDQPDLIENGVFFSLILIYLVNVIMLSALLCLAPGNLTWDNWLNQYLEAGQSLHHFVQHLPKLG